MYTIEMNLEGEAVDWMRRRNKLFQRETAFRQGQKDNSEDINARKLK